MKKFISTMLAATLVSGVASVAMIAANYDGTIEVLDSGHIVNEDGVVYDGVSTSAGRIYIDEVTPKSTIYIRLDDAVLGGTNASSHDAGQLANDNLYSVSSKKKTNGSLVKSIEVVEDKSLSGFSGRPDWVKIVLNDSTMTSEKKFEGSVTFKAKKSSTTANMNKYTNAGVESGDTFALDLNFYVNNKKVSNDDNPGAGDHIYFDPEENETNTLVWGDDLAALEFDASDDAGKFYARLSTKADMDIYNEYGDPVNADLWFFDFVGHPSIPSTARASLTLGIPWTDDDYAPDPANVYIYEKDTDGYLTDVTDKFVYSEDEASIEGWTIKTRTLGTYVISDTELDLDAITEEAPTTSDSESSSSTGDKVIPNTGSSDMVGLAVVAAVASLAAAGAVAFRKVSK